jgi:D-alanine-D-alanine ligase
MKKIRVGVLFGGRSTEHEISLQSAKNVIGNLDRQKYDIVPIAINKQGKLYSGINQIPTDLRLPLEGLSDNLSQLDSKSTNSNHDLVPSNLILSNEHLEFRVSDPIDVIFPVLHGSHGEDGTMQGFLKLVDIPFVGAGVLGSAIGMDKDITKRLLQQAGIPCAKGITIHRADSSQVNYQEIAAKLGAVLFVKPANLGSSVGINKVNNTAEFSAAVTEAFLYDNKILIEEFIPGREIECAVLGNDTPEASVLGEIVLNSGFYCYDSKYNDPNAASLKVPVDLPAQIAEKIRTIAVKTFRTLCCQGMARVDFLVQDNQGNFDIRVNEINTIPGFTKISMYPKLWEATGVSYSALLDKLINLAITSHNQTSQLKTTINN